MLGFKSAFVSLYVLQALVFICGFCGIIIHQVQRISSAQVYRLQALADKSLLSVFAPIIAAEMCNHVRENVDSMLLEVSNELFTKQLQIEITRDNDVWRVYKITMLKSDQHVGCWGYLFLEKLNEKSMLVYRGMQLRDFL